MKKIIIILNYHQISNKEDHSKRKSPFCVKESEFLQQLKLIQDLNIPIISFSEWNTKSVHNDLSIILTFDDGNKSDYEIAYKKLLKERIPASFFPILSSIGEKEYVNWDQLQEMANNGFFIGSHGVNHKSFVHLKENELLFELLESKRLIEEKINQKVDVISLPYGLHNRLVLNLIKKVGYNLALTTRSKINTSEDTFLLHRFNVKRDTSTQEFEQILLLNKGILNKKKIFSKLSFLINKLVGVNWLNSVREKL